MGLIVLLGRSPVNSDGHGRAGWEELGRFLWNGGLEVGLKPGLFACYNLYSTALLSIRDEDTNRKFFFVFHDKCFSLRSLGMREVLPVCMSGLHDMGDKVHGRLEIIGRFKDAIKVFFGTVIWLGSMHTWR